jgi:hypothetical protein
VTSERSNHSHDAFEYQLIPTGSRTELTARMNKLGRRGYRACGVVGVIASTDGANGTRYTLPHVIMERTL